MTTLGFIGLGQMGQPMVANLLKAGFAVQGFDLNPAAHAGLADQAGYRAAATPADAALGAQALILMLPDSRVVDALLWDGDAPLAQVLQRGQTVVDMGSSDPGHTRTNHSRLAALGIPLVDAPVSGGVKRARDGSLSIMVGGDAEPVAALQAVLAALGKAITHVGAAGAGHAVKALNNYVSAAGLLAVCEALTAAERFGIDPHRVNQVFNTSTGKNNTTEVKVEAFMLSGAFNSGFAMALMKKDLATAQAFIERMGSPGDFARLCLDTWAEADAALGPGADHTALYRHIHQTP